MISYVWRKWCMIEFSIFDRVHVRSLSEQQEAILQQHGCIVSVYPRRHPSGHMIQFPAGTRIQEEEGEARIVLPDGHMEILVVESGWYRITK